VQKEEVQDYDNSHNAFLQGHVMPWAASIVTKNFRVGQWHGKKICVARRLRIARRKLPG
jgi:hypothetical protein